MKCKKCGCEDEKLNKKGLCKECAAEESGEDESTESESHDKEEMKKSAFGVYHVEKSAKNRKIAGRTAEVAGGATGAYGIGQMAIGREGLSAGRVFAERGMPNASAATGTLGRQMIRTGGKKLAIGGTLLAGGAALRNSKVKKSAFGVDHDIDKAFGTGALTAMKAVAPKVKAAIPQARNMAATQLPRMKAIGQSKMTQAGMKFRAMPNAGKMTAIGGGSAAAGFGANSMMNRNKKF